MSDDIVERLRAWTGDQEPVMKQWDAWRSYIARGGGGSWPRDAFESLLDSFAEDANEASAAIERLTIERDRYASDAGERAAKLDAALADVERLLKINSDHCRAVNSYILDNSRQEDARKTAEARADAAEAEIERLTKERDNLQARLTARAKSPDSTLFGKYSRSK